MRLRPVLFGLLVLVVFLAPVAVATTTGTWALTGRPSAGSEDGGGGGGAGSEGGGGGSGGQQGQGGEGQGGGGQQGQGGEGAGNGPGRDGDIAPGEARGWMTLAEVSEANGIPVAEILDAFDLPATTDSATELRDLESASFSVAALREWLAGRAP